MAKKISYTTLTTMNAWQAALIERAIERYIESGELDNREAGHEHAERTLEEFRRFSNPGCVIRFE